MKIVRRMTDKEKKDEEEEDSKRKHCPISIDCWMSFLSNKINNWTVIFYMVGTVVISSLIVIMSIIIAVSQFQPLLFVEQIRSVGYISILFIFALYMSCAFFTVYYKYQKKVKPLEEILGDIIDGENDSNKVLERWEEINEVQSKDRMPEEEKRDEKNVKPPFSLRTGLFLLIIIVLLIALALLVVSPWFVARLILLIAPLFAVACYLMDKLKENAKAINEIKDRFGNVTTGIISGLVASHLTYLALTVDEISIPLVLLFVVPMAFAVMAVGFSLVVIWVFFTRN
jgi:ABC-type multidrug transport system fused ATPase/permease subunit